MLKKTVLLPLITTVLLTGCIEESNRDVAEKANRAVVDKALNQHPVPTISHFLTREAVVKQVQRFDEPGKLFYVYLLGQNGQQIGYYVSNTRPISTCTLLTPPDRKDGTVVLSNPGLGGTWSGGPCNSVFFFDAATDAYIETGGLPFFVSDQPLSVQSEPITVKAQ